MDKDIIVDKLHDLLNMIICIAIVLAIAYFSGFLNGFTPADFQDAFGRLTQPLTGKKYVSKNGIQPYNNYQPSKISPEVIRGANTLYAWRMMFASNTKTILYIYEDSDKDFHYQLQNYIAKSPIKTNYNVYAYTKRDFKNVRLGEGGPTQICNSVEECKAQRQRAADYGSSASFLEKCGKTMCVINPTKRQFVRLPKRDARQAVQMINALRNW